MVSQRTGTESLNFEEDYMRKQYPKPDEVLFDPDDKKQFKDENMYKYHDNTQKFDPQTQPYSFFYVSIAGQIEFGDFLELDGLAVKYDFVAGGDWNLASGQETRSGAG